MSRFVHAQVPIWFVLVLAVLAIPLLFGALLIAAVMALASGIGWLLARSRRGRLTKHGRSVPWPEEER